MAASSAAGTVEFVPDEDKYEALMILMRHYHAEDFKFNTDMIKVTAVLKLTVTEMTGKRRKKIPLERVKIESNKTKFPKTTDSGVSLSDRAMLRSRVI